MGNSVISNTLGKVTHVTWTLTDADPLGDPFIAPGLSDRSVQVFGSFGGGSVKLQGTNEISPVNWAQLHEPSGTDISFGAAGIEAVLENTTQIRPVLQGSTGGSVTVILVSRG